MCTPLSDKIAYDREIVAFYESKGTRDTDWKSQMNFDLVTTIVVSGNSQNLG